MRSGGAPAEPAERWLRHGIGLVGCLLLVAMVSGSAGSDSGRTPAAPATSTPTAGSPPTAAPGSPAPSAPEVTAPAPVLGALGGAEPVPTAAGVARVLAGPLADPRLGGRLVGTVIDAESGAVLLDRGAGQPAIPASTAKLTTAAAVLAALPADFRIATRLVAGAGPGEVVLVGGGDPTLSAAAPGTPTGYPGAARLADLAAAARRGGVHTVSRVVVDGSRFPGPAVAPGWDPVDLGSSYAAPITAVAVDGGRVGPRAAVRSTVPDLAAGRALAALLGSPGAAVLRGTASPNARLLGQVRSAPMAGIVEQMLLASDNVLAEALARQVAVAERLPASFAGAAEAVRQVLGRLGIPVGTQLVDGSGLSRRDRISAAALAAVLRTAVSTAQPALHGLVPGLPVSGYDGTLGDRYRAGPPTAAAGVVRAKTGSLTGVTSLAGMVTDADGRLLVFAFLADKVPAGGIRAAEAALDVVTTALGHCGCR